MKIEFAPKDCIIHADYDSAVFYCFMFEINSHRGWRLPTKEEIINYVDTESERWEYWYSNTPSITLELFKDTKFKVIPVRDIC